MQKNQYIILMLIGLTGGSFEFAIAKNPEDTKVQSYSILGSPASEETTKLASDLLTKIDPNKKLTSVLQMNSFMRYWLGEKNALAIPGLNYLLVNENWLKNLSPEAQRFVIGRTLVTLTSAEHLLFTSILPAILILFPNVNLTIIIPIIALYLARQAEYNADASAIRHFDCLIGAGDALEDMKNIPNAINLLGLILPFSLIKRLLPGKLTNRTSKLGAGMRDLPLLHYCSKHPSTQSRIDALEEL